MESTGGFLPVSREDMRQQHIETLDFVYVCGDAYVDHPSFGHAIISRVLVSRGYTVGIISQPDWKDEKSVQILGRPRLGFLVSAGNMDSMVNHYYVSKKRRKADAYSPGGVSGKRPDRATVVYANLIRRVYKDIPIIIGGIEASLRRLAHYDYWSDSFKRSILLDSSADLLSYGMGERSIVEIADALASGIAVSDITFVRGTVFRTRTKDTFYDEVYLPSYEAAGADKRLYAQSFQTQMKHTDPYTGKMLVEEYPHQVYVVQNPPALPLTTEEMDAVYALPYTRRAHPSYDALGQVPATQEIQFSLVSSRGCFGGCSFCALTFHQGRIIQARSHESILREAELMTHEPDFKGYIHDVGGPTANFRQPSCDKQKKDGVCPSRQCLFPTPCPNLKVSHKDYISLLRKLRGIEGVKKVFIRSGIRFDYLLADADETFLDELVKYHISGQLKVAPEHVSDRVLARMGKPKNAVFEQFLKKYEAKNKAYGMSQYVVPYLMSSHPGSTLKDAVLLAEYVRDLGYTPQQVQDFYPTPSTVSTVMYYTGIDPRDMSQVYVPTDPHEKAMQRALIQYKNPDNYELVKEALHKAGRTDLIGFGPKCLIPPRKMKGKAAEGRIGKPKQTGKLGQTRKAKQTGKSGQAGKAKQADKQRLGGTSGRKPGSGRTVHTSQGKTSRSAKDAGKTGQKKKKS